MDKNKQTADRIRRAIETVNKNGPVMFVVFAIDDSYFLILKAGNFHPVTLNYRKTTYSKHPVSIFEDLDEEAITKGLLALDEELDYKAEGKTSQTDFSRQTLS